MTIDSTKNVDASYYGSSPNNESYNGPSQNDTFNSQKTPVIQVSTNKNSATDQSSEIELQSESNHSIAKNTKRKESRISHGNTVSKKSKIVNVSHSSEEEEK